MAWNLKDLEKNLLIGSTLAEGSTLTEKESVQVLAGKTIQGHPIQEMRELTNYRSATERLMNDLKKTPFISSDLVLEFHRRLMSGIDEESGRFKSSANFTYLTSGERFDFEKPATVAPSIKKWVHDFNAEPSESPLDSGAQLYYEFQRIHPFRDGNGRMGRVFSAYWFHWRMKKDFRFFLKDRIPLLKALEAANAGNLKLLQSFFEKRLF